jgi:asparagine synthetase B (glutamine-hydrolysing)
MTVNALLPVPNFAWREGEPAGIVADPGHLSLTGGRFAVAVADTDDGTVWIARDKLGLNKVFVAWHEGRGVLVANFLHDLLRAGVPLDAVFAVPAGSLVRFDLVHRRVEHDQYFVPVPQSDEVGASLELVFADVRRALIAALRRMREQVGPRISIGLSGGLDSALVAAYAREEFEELTAYTYTYQEVGAEPSDDFLAAERVAEHLGLALVAVTADRGEVLAAVDDALLYGQDWRDFNVHCAIVNVLLARVIATTAPVEGGTRPAVLTGDLMNELLADYTPIVFAGQMHYPLPQIPFDRLRRVLVTGLQAGDREVGVFHALGVDVLQPYASCCEELLRIPSSVCERDGKRAIMEQLADGRLPSWLLRREKVRAQVGDDRLIRGILPVLVEAGQTPRWLEQRFAAMHRVRASELRAFMRAGVYRRLRGHQPEPREDGYVRL